MPDALVPIRLFIGTKISNRQSYSIICGLVDLLTLQGGSLPGR